MNADDKLLHELGGMFQRVDPVPREVTLAARSAIAWRRMDAALAELLEESAAEVLAVRSDGGFRVLAFEAPDGYGIEIEVGRTTETVRSLVGQLLPPESAAVIVRHADVTIEATADELGRFLVEGVPAGPVSLRVEFGDHSIETGWVTI